MVKQNSGIISFEMRSDIFWITIINETSNAIRLDKHSMVSFVTMFEDSISK